MEPYTWYRQRNRCAKTWYLIMTKEVDIDENKSVGKGFGAIMQRKQGECSTDKDTFLIRERG